MHWFNSKEIVYFGRLPNAKLQAAMPTNEMKQMFRLPINFIIIENITVMVNDDAPNSICECKL